MPEAAPVVPDGLGPAAVPHAAEPVVVNPGRLLSEIVVKDRRSRGTRKMLTKISSAERMEQLCVIEAMAQVAAWRSAMRPDRVVPHAISDTKIVGHSLSAGGAALYTKGEWFKFNYKCEL